jgi:hypothetical protein
MCLSRYGEENFLKFVKALESERPDLAKSLHSDFERQKSEHFKENMTCIKCCIYNQVDIKDVVDDLYTNGFVDKSFLERTLAFPFHRERRQLWNEVFLKMQSETDDNRRIYYESLKTYILQKYRSVFSHFPDFDINEKTMKCLCKGKTLSESSSSCEEGNWEAISTPMGKSLTESSSSCEDSTCKTISTPSLQLKDSAEVKETPPITTTSQVRWRPKLRRRRKMRPTSKMTELLTNVLYQCCESFQSTEQSSTDLSIDTPLTTTVSQVRRNPKLRKRRNIRPKSKITDLLPANVLYQWCKSLQSRQDNEQDSKDIISDLSGESPSTTTATQVRQRPELRKRRNIRPRSKLTDFLLAKMFHQWYKSFQSSEQSSTDLSLTEDAKNSETISDDPVVLREKRVQRCAKDSGFASCKMSSIDVVDEKKVMNNLQYVRR